MTLMLMRMWSNQNSACGDIPPQLADKVENFVSDSLPTMYPIW